jgi:hypothetical protein
VVGLVLEVIIGKARNMPDGSPYLERDGLGLQALSHLLVERQLVAQFLDEPVDTFYLMIHIVGLLKSLRFDEGLKGEKSLGEH